MSFDEVARAAAEATRNSMEGAAAVQAPPTVGVADRVRASGSRFVMYNDVSLRCFNVDFFATGVSWSSVSSKKVGEMDYEMTLRATEDPQGLYVPCYLYEQRLTDKFEVGSTSVCGHGSTCQVDTETTLGKVCCSRAVVLVPGSRSLEADANGVGKIFQMPLRIRARDRGFRQLLLVTVDKSQIIASTRPLLVLSKPPNRRKFPLARVEEKGVEAGDHWSELSLVTTAAKPNAGPFKYMPESAKDVVTFGAESEDFLRTAPVKICHNASAAGPRQGPSGSANQEARIRMLEGRINKLEQLVISLMSDRVGAGSKRQRMDPDGGLLPREEWDYDPAVAAATAAAGAGY